MSQNLFIKVSMHLFWYSKLKKLGKGEVVEIFAKMFRTFVYILEENNQQTQIAKQKFKKFWHVLKLDFWILMEVWNSLNW